MWCSMLTKRISSNSHHFPCYFGWKKKSNRLMNLYRFSSFRFFFLFVFLPLSLSGYLVWFIVVVPRLSCTHTVNKKKQKQSNKYLTSNKNNEEEEEKKVVKKAANTDLLITTMTKGKKIHDSRKKQSTRIFHLNVIKWFDSVWFAC